jgi:hypothetical protein
MSCGTALQKKAEDGRTLLRKDDLAGIAGTHTYTPLSPLAPYYQGPVKMKTANLEPSALNALLRPDRAFFLIDLTRDSFRQDVLLIRDSSCYRWEEETSGISFTKEANPREFIGRTTKLLAGYSSKGNTSLMSIKTKLLKTLTAVAVLCRNLSTIHRAASFITISHLESFIGTGEGLPAEIKDLSQQGFIRCIGAEEPLIVLDKKGEELLLLLNEYERYFILQILTDGISDYPSLHFAARKGSLYLLTNPKGSDCLVIRRVDPEGISSLINWAWTTSVSIS